MNNQQLKGEPQTRQSTVRDNESRRVMLAAIRERLAASAPFDAVRSQHGAHPEVANRGGRVAAIAPAQANTLTERFCGALETVSAHSAVVRDEREAATALQKIIEKKNARRIAISD